MKPETNYPGSPFNFDAIPMWLYPEVWDESKPVKLRGLWFVVLYTLSAMVCAGFVFLPIALYSGNWPTVSVIWLMFGGIGGIVIGLAVWRSFTKRVRKMNSEK